MTEVVVVGSVNVDLVLSVRRIARPGETVLASAVSRGAGGKGANQAVAAARAGAATALVAALGDDHVGGLLRGALAANGVDLRLLRTVPEPTGRAVVTVDETGENAITVAPSANAELVLDEHALDAIRRAGVVLIQLEIPMPAVRAAAAAGRYVILNAAPAAALDDDLLADVDVLVVNEHEARIVSGIDTDPGAALLARVPAVIVTLGGSGALVLRRDAEPVQVPGYAVEVVDTTGAGDTFCGVLAATIAGGTDLPAAVARANAAAALSVQSTGAMASTPSAAAIDALLASSGS
jgi:ribokinase